jgi:glycosyltransferase involved in cell wall biosynthesis
MNVIILTSEMRVGGTARDAIEWANRLVDCGDSVLLVARSTEGGGTRPLSPAVKLVGLGGGRAFSSTVCLLGILRKNPDASILANAGSLAGLAIIFRVLGLIRHRIVFVDPFNPANTFRSGWKPATICRYLLWNADAFVHLSGFAERFHRKLGLRAVKSRLIPNISARSDEITPIRPLGAILRCVAVGRLDKIKGFDRLIDAFGAVATRWPGATLRIIGEGYDRPRLEEAIREAGLSDCVMLVGHSDSVRAELRQADIFILPSLYEGMPNTLIEALDEGLRIVATPCRGGVNSLMREIGASAMVVHEADFTDGLLRAIDSALSLGDPGWAKIHARYREIFDNKQNFKKLRQLLA